MSADSFDPAERNRQLDEEKARQENSAKKDGGKDGGDIFKPHDKADPAKLQEVVPRSSGNSNQDHSVAAQWGRETYGVTPRDITFGTESGKVIYGKEYNENGKPMLLSPDGTRYEGTMHADGKGIASWQQVNSDGKMGPALNVTAERSGLPPNPAKPETYVNSNQARRENEGNPARSTLPAGDTSINARQARGNQNEVQNPTLNFAPLHKGDVPQAQPAKALTSDAASANPQKNFSEMTRQERRDIQQQNRDAGGGGNPWKAVDQQGVTRTLGGDRLTALGANSNPEKPNQPGKPEAKPENPKANERSTTGGSQPFEAVPRQQRPVNENQPGKPEGLPSKDSAKDAGGPHGDGRGKSGPADIFPAAPKPEHGGIGLKLSPEAVKRLADLIGDMQSGKALGRDNIDIAKLLGGMKPEQLAGLKSALADGKFDMSQLDGKMQANLSKAFEQLAKGPHEGIGRPGGPQELGAAGRVLDLLQGKQFDKIPTGDQTRQILAELFKGFKDGGSLAGSADLSAMLGRSLMKPGEVAVDGRSLGQIPGMRFDLKDAGPLMQALMARMELGKINEGSISQLGKLADVIGQKIDTKDGATLEVKAELKTQSNLDVSKLSDTVRSALMGGELGRAIGRETGKDGQPNSKDANPLVEDGDAAPVKTQSSDLSAPGMKTEAELTQKRLEDEAAKQKKQQDEVADTIKQKGLTAEQIAQELAQMQKMEEQRKAQEKEEKERREREEKKRREDEERVHIVKKGETLHIISRKYFNNDKNAQIIYARNKSTIKVVNYKGQPYCSLKEKQKLYIPSPKFVDSFMKGTTSYNHINFGKIPFSTPEEELAFLFGGADLGAAAGLLGINKKRPSLFNHDEDSEPVSRRSFSGKDASVDDEERKANVEQILNPAAAVKKPVEMEGIRHTIRLGETLSSIALRRYGQAAYWRLIAWKNKLAMEESTAHSKMTRGLILYMPTNDEMSAYDADPDQMLSLIPSKFGIFIESKSGISMPALKICGECGRTTFYTARSCMRCETDLSDIPIIIDALGVGVELDLIDLDGHLPGEDSGEPVSGNEIGNGNGAHHPAENSASIEHQMQYREFEPPSADLVAKELSKELTDSIVPHQEVEHMDPAVLAAMSQAESSEQVDHVGDIPLPEVAFARRNARNVFEPVPSVVPEDKAIDAVDGQNFSEQEAPAADQSIGALSDLTDEENGEGFDLSPGEVDSEIAAQTYELASDELDSRESSLIQPPAIDDVRVGLSSEEDNDDRASKNIIQPQVNENRSGDAESAAEQPISPSELMQHNEEDEAAMMELFPDCDSVLDESILKCEYVDEMVRIAERGDVDSRDGFCVTLEMVSDGNWSKVCQYRIYAFNCFIEVYCRANGSRRPERVQEKSLQSKIAIEMAWNHFNRNWQEMCTEFWHS